MYVKHWLSVSVLMACITSAWAAEQATSAAAAPKEKASTSVRTETAVPLDANIGTITRLARQLKIAQMERDLRDAQKSASAASAPQGSAQQQPAGSPVTAPRPVAASMPPPRPMIGQIGGMGGALRAYLLDGRELTPGMKLTLSDGSSWTARSIKSTYVTFDVCPDPAKQHAPAGRRGRRDVASAEEVPVCVIQNVTPVSY